MNQEPTLRLCQSWSQNRRYCDRMTNLQPNPHTREGIRQFISEITTILNGLIRLKGEDTRVILTSVAEGVMDPELRALWNQRTDSKKTTPQISELLQFMKDQADHMEDEPSTGPTKGWERVKHRQNPKHKGAAHSAVSAAPTQQRGSQPKQNHHPQGGTPSTSQYSTAYACPVCQGGHPLFHCPTFKGYTVTQRREKVMALKLCLNCFKPHHVAHDCNSSYRCKSQDCGKKHNSLLHEDRTVTTTTANHQTNSTTHAEDIAAEENEECLLMTAKVTLIGPTGQMRTVRALLDAGSTVSILSSNLVRHLHLANTGRDVSISGIKSKSNKQSHPTFRVTLASEHDVEWRREITVAAMEEVIRQLPLQDAQSVREMKHLQDLELADDQFDQPGKIDLLLGQNVWRHLFLEGKVRSEREEDPEAWHTVFGWTVLGNYNPHSQHPSQQAITHVAASIEDSKASDSILERFHELEEPSEYYTAQTPTEIKVEQFFQETHTYDSEEKRYTVKLPRKDNPPRLGESKTQATNRAVANDRSLKRKGNLSAFQQVMGEYEVMGHSQEVNETEHPNNPQSYYMPVHAVIKESSTSTKLRPVFDASAKTTSGYSLNDILEVGPTLYPTIDKILLRFRLPLVAVSSDIGKMYPQVKLHPDDQPLHRYIWRKSEDEPWKEYEMKRVAFGVASSPYLAVKVLQQTGEDHGKRYPEAQWHIKNSFMWMTS